MESIKKYKKILLVLIFILLISISMKVQGYEFTAKNTARGTFKPYAADPAGSWTFYCAQHHNPYRADLPAGYDEGATYGEWCEICGEDTASKPTGFDTEKYSMKYNWTSTIDERYYQDAAYVIATAYEEGKITDQSTQYSLWNTAVNTGKADDNKGVYGREAVAYKNFYNDIHVDKTDIYSSKIYDKTTINDVTVEVDQNSKTYIVGPFTIEYPNGDYVEEGTSRQQKWSYITNIELLNQDGNAIGNVLNNTIDIIDDSGNELRDTLHNNNFPNSNVPFYVRFSSTLGDINQMRLRVNFQYLESCTATLQQYDGAMYRWVWNEVDSGKRCAWGHPTKTWKLSVSNAGTPQRLVAWQYIENNIRANGRASKNIKYASLIVAPQGIDLTMKISGQVFLDRDNGKVNTGNNIMDGKNEVLPEVEVVLYDAATNQVVTKTNRTSQYHIHNSTCYELKPSTILVTNPDHPYHIGNCDEGGPGTCFETPAKHVHSGSPEPVAIGTHSHTDACYSEGHIHNDLCYEKRTYGQAQDGCTSGDYGWQNGVKCPHGYTYGKHETKTLICDKNETSRELICGYEEGEMMYSGSGCYTKPVYHTHKDTCYTGGGECGGKISESEPYHSGCFDNDGDGLCDRGGQACANAGNPGHWDTTKTCSKCSNPVGNAGESCRNTSGTPTLTCGFNEGQVERFDLNCGFSGSETFGWELSCTIPTLIGKTTDQKVLTCGQSGTITGNNSKTLVNPVITDNNGYYEFAGLDSMKKYYVKFVYNGMLYTNVQPFVSGFNTDNDSKADETSRYDYRTPFNNKFAEIGSYPSNYTIVKKVFDNEHFKDGKNKVYLQEDIADIFKRISEKMVNTHTDDCTAAAQAVYHDLEGRYGSQEEKVELQRKIQFAVDCRVQSQTLNNYPLKEQFTISTVGKTIGNVFYPPIYSGTYNQLHVNLGIKARTTFDMTLYKDVLKAEVSINGKTETYNYDSRKSSSTFKFGVSEEDYLNGLRGMYQNGIDYKNSLQTSGIETDNYDLNMRTEEVANGQNTSYNSGLTGKVDGNYQVNDNYNLAEADRLKIKVTYKIAIRNESSVTGAITELVDYYDTNYRFVESYVGDVDGNKTGDVTKYDSSMYANSEYKSTKNSYTTIYLRPNVEQRLNNAEEQYIYVVLELVGPSGDVGTLLTNKLLNDNSTLNTMNLVEINGYKTYNSKTDSTTPGLIDKDSNPGNLNISNIDALTQNNIVNYPNIRAMYEDDTNRAPVLIYKTTNSKTIEGTVFEDSTGKTNVVTGGERSGNGTLDSGETGIRGVIVELIEIKNNEMIVRATTKTNQNGWYGFTGFIPGDYVIRYTYGADNDTALSNSSVFEKGLNSKSYNGQDYQFTTYTVKGDTTQVTPKTDSNLIQRYTDNHNAKNSEESTVKVTSTMTIDKHNNNYWYTVADAKSDAKDYAYRVNQVIDYSKKEYGTEITNHKAEVFNAYANPQPDHINNADANSKLVNELERRTYRYAYTPVIEVEVEYATKTTTGNKEESHKIMGVDFGIVERSKSELTIDQDVKHIKVTLADGRVLFDTETGTDNLQWIAKGDINKYDKNELVNVIMDEELINGATIEITYNITVRNNSEAGTGTTRAKTILNYVANNLNYDQADNGNLWKVVSKDSVQNDKNSTFVNSKAVDLSTQSVILQATEENPLTSTNLGPGQQETTELKLKKVLSTESSTDDLTYTNMSEIVEIDNTIGRYDHEATPGNQKLELQPREHDTSGASKYTSFDSIGQPDPDYPPDGVIIVTPPTGSNYIYYVIGITGALILAVGIFLIKKFVIDKKK